MRDPVKGGFIVNVVPRVQTKLTARQRRDLRRLLAKVKAAEGTAAAARVELDRFLADPEVSIPAAARELGLTSQALYQRVRRTKS